LYFEMSSLRQAGSLAGSSLVSRSALHGAYKQNWEACEASQFCCLPRSCLSYFLPSSSSARVAAP
jgi:hypothetical protein